MAHTVDTYGSICSAAALPPASHHASACGTIAASSRVTSELAAPVAGYLLLRLVSPRPAEYSRKRKASDNQQEVHASEPVSNKLSVGRPIETEAGVIGRTGQVTPANVYHDVQLEVWWLFLPKEKEQEYGHQQ